MEPLSPASPSRSPTPTENAATEKNLKETLARLNLDQFTDIGVYLRRKKFLTVPELKELLRIDKTETSAEVLERWAEDRGQNFTKALYAALRLFEEEDRAESFQELPYGPSKGMVSTATASSQIKIQSELTKAGEINEQVQSAISWIREILVAELTSSDITEILHKMHLKKALSDLEKQEIEAKTTDKVAASCLLDIVLRQANVSYIFYAALPKIDRGLVKWAMHRLKRGDRPNREIVDYGYAASEVDQETATPLDSNVRALMRAVPPYMRKIQDDIGSFSSSLDGNMHLHVKVHDDKTATELKSLETQLIDFMKQYISEPRVIITQGPPTAKAC